MDKGAKDYYAACELSNLEPPQVTLLLSASRACPCSRPSTSGAKSHLLLLSARSRAVFQLRSSTPRAPPTPRQPLRNSTCLPIGFLVLLCAVLAWLVHQRKKYRFCRCKLDLHTKLGLDASIFERAAGNSGAALGQAARPLPLAHWYHRQQPAVERWHRQHNEPRQASRPSAAVGD